MSASLPQGLLREHVEDTTVSWRIRDQARKYCELTSAFNLQELRKAVAKEQTSLMLEPVAVTVRAQAQGSANAICALRLHGR